MLYKLACLTPSTSRQDSAAGYYIRRDDGTTATFRVDSVETFPKHDFPSDRVYKNAPDAQIRLITCAGDYDKSAKDYRKTWSPSPTLTSSPRHPLPEPLRAVPS